MSKEKANSPHSPKSSFRDLEQQIDEFREKRDDLNKKTKEYITELQNIDIGIEELLKTTKETLKRKRDYWNSKVKKLKDKKIEYKKFMDGLIDEKRKLENNSKTKDGIKGFSSIKQIDRKIENLERQIETEKLDITEENSIIDKIRELTEVKQQYLSNQQNSELFKLERKIQIVRLNLNKIYEQLTKWSNKSQNYHSKMTEVYDKVNELREKKRKLEEDLIENKKTADAYHEQFLKVMNKRKSLSKKGKYKKSQKKSKPSYKFDSKRNEELEKMKQDKLATALEKQKAGKKLNLYEARLILEKRSS